MSKLNLEAGDVVQIDPNHDPMFGGAFMIVTERKAWGAQGYVPMGVYMQETDADRASRSGQESAAGPGAKQAFYRCPTEAMTYIGRAEWDTEHSEELE